MIMSFMIFIGFIIAIFIFINPLQERPADYSTMNDIESKIINNLSRGYKSVSVILSSELESESCFSIDNPLNIGDNFLVRASDDFIAGSKKTADGKISIDYIVGTRFYVIYFSDYFNSFNLLEEGCAILEKNQYSYGVLDFKNSVIYENLLALNVSYQSNYAALKQELNLAKDFDFAVYDLDKNLLISSRTTNKVQNTNIISRDIPLKVLDKDALKKDIILNLRTW